jgi:TRAP-type transport system periplasmic protein
MRKLLCGVAAMTMLAGTAAAQEVTLRGASSFAADTAFSRPYEAFVEWINEHGAGVLQIQNVGGPEAVPPFELGNAVSSGVVDVANVTAAFYTNVLPEGDAFKLAQNTIQDQRQNGCYELIDNLHQDRMNVKYLGRTGDHVQFHLYLRSPIDSPDLAGLTIRTTPVYQAMFQALGATPVTTAPGEVYTALERGTIDGYGWPIQGVLDLGRHEQTSYRVDPGFYQVDVNILVNRDRWESLSEEQRALLEEGIAWLEAQNENNVATNEQEAAKQSEAGIEVITFEGADEQRWLEAAETAGWESAVAVNQEFAEQLRACYSR